MKLTKTILRNPPEGHIQTRRATLLPARRFRVWRRGSRAKGQDTRARPPGGRGGAVVATVRERCRPQAKRISRHAFAACARRCPSKSFGASLPQSTC